jgi:hypothetical protein
VVDLAAVMFAGHSFRCVGNEFANELRAIDDDRVLLGLHDLGAHVVCTLDDSMLELPHVLLAIEQSRLTVATVQAAGHRELRALGAMLLWLPDLVAAYKADEPQIFRWRPKHSREYESPRENLARLAEARGIAVGQLRREAQRTLSR